ncbi:MAG: hypothetical protein ACLR0V_07445 [Roseburia hominis]
MFTQFSSDLDDYDKGTVAVWKMPDGAVKAAALAIRCAMAEQVITLVAANPKRLMLDVATARDRRNSSWVC